MKTARDLSWVQTHWREVILDESHALIELLSTNPLGWEESRLRYANVAHAINMARFVGRSERTIEEAKQEGFDLYWSEFWQAQREGGESG